MNNDAYEQAYTEARAVLHRRGRLVESPTIGNDGIRYCRVNGLPLTDREVFEDAWGEGLAEEILREQDSGFRETDAAGASKRSCHL
jgi:hypothetical protein